MRRFPTGLSLGCALAVVLAASVSTQDLNRHPGEDWPTYGGSFSHQRFSQLRQVTTSNVSRLRVKWTFPVPEAGAIDRSLQTTPLVVRGRDAGLAAFDAIMLVTTPVGRVLALDAAKGRMLWEFVPPLRTPLKICCSASNRGAAFGRVARWFRGFEPRVYVATLDARLWALSASTGKPVGSFGDGVGPAGSVTVGDNRAGFSLTMAPLFIPRTDVPRDGATRRKDLVIVGSSGGEFESRGFVTAYDALRGRWCGVSSPSPPPTSSEARPGLPCRARSPIRSFAVGERCG